MLDIDSVPSKIQIRQWFVTIIIVTAAVWPALVLWTDNVDYTIFSLWI